MKSKVDELKERLTHLISEQDKVLEVLYGHYSAGELIKYKANPNPNVEALQLARILEVGLTFMNVERYRPDGSTMKGIGHIKDIDILSVIKVPELDVDNA